MKKTLKTVTVGWLVWALGASVAVAEDEVVNWDFNVFGPQRHLTKGIEAIVEHVSQETDGNFTITVHYGGALGKGRDQLDNIKLGAFEMALYCVCFGPAKTPAASALMLPFLPVEGLENTIALRQGYYDNQVVKDEFARWNALVLMDNIIPQNTLIGKGEPPQSLEDFDGMRVRALASSGTAMELLGATTVAIPSPEIYQGYERGMVDSVSMPYYGFSAFKLDDLSDWYTAGFEIGAFTVPTLINIDAWNDLPEAYRTALQEAVPLGHAALVQAYREVDAVNLPKWSEMGLTEVRFDPDALDSFIETTGRGIWTDWVTENADRGIPAQDLLDGLLADARAIGTQ